MGLFHKKAKKNIQELIVERLKEKTNQKIIYFHLLEEKTDIFDNKLGGAFYVPKGQEIPKNQNTNQPLYLLVQLNFERLPYIPSFPQKGLLQIFIAGDDDIYGADFDNPIVQKGFYVRFIRDIPINILEDCIHNPQWNEEICLPFGKVKEYQLVGEIKEQPISIHDMRFNQYLLKYCRDLLPEDCENFYDLDDKTTDYFYDHLPTYGCQAGGYPCFTQYDPRENSYQDYDVLLFQLDTVKDIMWGDSGVANFFIRKEDLQNEDFSSVLFHWDCC